jgi:hypothetical protein
MTTEAPPKSRLVLVGVVFLAASMFLPGSFWRWADQATSYNARLLFAILSDVFRTCFFVALGCLIIGALRNRRWRKEAASEQGRVS